MCNYECCVISKNTRKSTCIARGTKKNCGWYWPIRIVLNCARCKYDGTIDVGLLLYLAHARTCTIFAWVYGEDVDAVYSTLIVPLNKKKIRNCNQGLSVVIPVFTEAKAGYFIKQDQDLLDFQKVRVMEIHEIGTILLHMYYVWFKKSHNNREAFLNPSTSYPAVYNCDWNFAQAEGGCIQWNDQWFSLNSPPIWSWKPERRQTSHNSFWYKPPGNTSLSFWYKQNEHKWVLL